MVCTHPYRTVHANHDEFHKIHCNAYACSTIYKISVHHYTLIKFMLEFDLLKQHAYVCFLVNIVLQKVQWIFAGRSWMYVYSDN